VPVLPPYQAFGRVGGVWRSTADWHVTRSGVKVVPLDVWVRHGGVWKLLFTDSPAFNGGVTAALNGNGSVQVSWSATTGAERASSYTVKRSDGSIVATVTALMVAGQAYSIADSAPLAGTAQTWTVTPNIGVTVGAPVTSNTLSIAAAPGSVTATPSGTSTITVAVAWAASLGAVSYTVYRPDGSTVGTVAAPTVTLVDSAPTPGTAGYSVKANALGGAQGPAGTSAALTIAQAPTLSSVTFVSGQSVQVTWTAGSVGQRTGFGIYRNGVQIATVATGVLTYTDTAGLIGESTPYYVRALINAIPGGQSATANGNVPANVPTSVTATPTGLIGQLQLSWGFPTGYWSGFEWQYLSDPGGVWTTPMDSMVPPVSYTWAPGAGSRSLRVRSLSPGGSSAWVTVSATPAWDATPPANVTNTSWQPEASYGRMVIRFNTPNDDIAAFRIYYQIDSGSPVLWTDWVGCSPNTAYAYNTVNGSAGQRMWSRVDVRDGFGNVRVGDWIYYDLATSPIPVLPSGVGHWRNGAYGQNSGDPNRPFQGYFTDPALTYIGMFWYGTALTDACNASASLGGKKPITGMSLILNRIGGGNNVQDCCYVGSHDGINKPANGTVAAEPGVNYVDCIGTLAYGGVGEFWTTAGAWTRIRDGIDRGFAMKAPTGKPYMTMARTDENVFQGAVNIHHLG
jgi:hypothetical protein